MIAHACPDCQSEQLHVIAYGLPGRLCTNGRCCALRGPAEWVLRWAPFNGEFLVYEPGGYWRALWEWVRGA